MTETPKLATADAFPARRRPLIIFNPAAGARRRSRLEAVISELGRLGAAVALKETSSPGHATRIANAASEADCDVVVAAGGDGTINEVANGLAGRGLPLAIIPLGTANVLAAEIGLPSSASELARSILDGSAITLHPGMANGRQFLMMAGIGFDAEVVAAVSPRQKRMLGKAAYVLQSLALLLRYRYPEFQVTVDGRTMTAKSVIITKGRFYAGRHLCAPDACLTEPTFEVCIFRQGGALAVLRYGAALLFDRLPRHPQIELLSGRTISVRCDARLPIQGDGDYFGVLPLSAHIAPAPITVIGPESDLSRRFPIPDIATARRSN